MLTITEEHLVQWQAQVDALARELDPLFRRSEVRERVRRLLQGFLGRVERKNGWQLAEAIGESEPHGVQRLFYEAVWDADALRDVLQRYVLAQVGSPAGVLVVDETGFLKKGTHSVGVARQYCGTAGKVENCQVAVFLTYASPRGHTFLDRALYLPEAWTTDRPRLQAAGVPDEVGFATKPALACQLLTRALEAAAPHAWIVGDHVYGDDGALRAMLEERGEAYALGVAATHMLWDGGTAHAARDLIAAQPPEAWAQLSAGRGSQGERWFQWCWLQLAPADERGLAAWLVARRTLGTAPAVAYFRVFGPAGTTLAALALVIGTRWTVEECFEEAKTLTGLDQYEVRQWVPWHRHITLAMLAHALLAVIRAESVDLDRQKGGPAWA